MIRQRTQFRNARIRGFADVIEGFEVLTVIL